MLMDVDFDDNTPNRCTTLVYYAWKIFTCLFLHVLLVTMVVCYCLLGAFAFEKLEKDNEIEVSGSHGGESRVYFKEFSEGGHFNKIYYRADTT